jgi:hypothetical protein
LFDFKNDLEQRVNACSQEQRPGEDRILSQEVDFSHLSSIHNFVFLPKIEEENHVAVEAGKKDQVGAEDVLGNLGVVEFPHSRNDYLDGPVSEERFVAFFGQELTHLRAVLVLANELKV